MFFVKKRRVRTCNNATRDPKPDKTWHSSQSDSAALNSNLRRGNKVEISRCVVCLAIPKSVLSMLSIGSLWHQAPLVTEKSDMKHRIWLNIFAGLGYLWRILNAWSVGMWTTSVLITGQFHRHMLHGRPARAQETAMKELGSQLDMPQLSFSHLTWLFLGLAA